MAKADIDFEKELWDAADELRGAVSENNYKNYILPLVFLKHLSERHDMVHEDLENQLSDPKSDRYTIDRLIDLVRNSQFMREPWRFYHPS